MTSPNQYDPRRSPRLEGTAVVGRPVPRVDGLAKVTGRATYAYEYRVPGATVAYGVVVEATITTGRIVDLDVTGAERTPGVLLVLTHRNTPPQALLPPPAVTDRLARARPVLFDAQVRYRGEPIALVVADSFEAARSAAHLVTARYQETPAATDLLAELKTAYAPAKVGPSLETDTALGDFDTAYAASPVQLDDTYWTSYQVHNPMEPHAALAAWNGDALTAYVSQQTMATAKTALAATLKMPPEKVRLVSRYVGGGFGSKLPLNCEVVLASLAARVLSRPVKVALTRQQTFSNTGHRAAFHQRVRLGASRFGTLEAIAHEVWSQTSRFDEYAEQAATPVRSLYASAHRLTSHRLVPLDLQHGESMRAPGEAPGLLALETAMDDLAVRLGMDPVELRIRNEPTVDPERGVPFSSRQLVECLREGARRFGWSDRPTAPRSRRDGRQLIGYGMSAGIRPNRIVPATARIRLRADGGLIVEVDMTDIGTGTGSYTILAQIASECLGVPIAAVDVRLGDSNFPATPGSAGSLGAGSAGSALFNACRALRGKLTEGAVADPRSPLYGVDPNGAELAGGTLTIGAKSERLAQIASRLSDRLPGAEGSVAASIGAAQLSQHAYAAFFVEVAVDADTAEVRLRRMLGVFDVGRVLNESTARSQLIGGMVWGVSAALHEEAIIDARFGKFVNDDLAGYHVPVNADIRGMEAVCLSGRDDLVNPLGSKGIGEIAICGSGAAVGNAVFNATGVRIREFPVTLDKILAQLPAEPL